MPRHQLPRPLITPHLHLPGLQSIDQRRQNSPRNRPVNKNRLHRIANRRILHLAIHRNRNRHLDIGGGIDINMAYAIGMTQHRNIRVPLNMLHQRIRPTRNHQVDHALQLQQLLNRSTPIDASYRRLTYQSRLAQTPDGSPPAPRA